jgi:hypothetical protein
MLCTEFLARYSEYRDGTVTAPREQRRFQGHVSACPRCRAFDAAVRDGVAALREVPTVTPSTAFRRRLDQRLAVERARAASPRVPVLLQVAAALLVVAALSLVGWQATRPSAPRAVAAIPPVAFPKPVINAGVPLVTFQDPRATVLAGNPYPYGTAFVQPATRR